MVDAVPSRIHALLNEYGESHRDPVNKRIHWVCVPLIVWSVIGLTTAIPVPAVLPQSIYTWPLIVVSLSMIYYLQVSRKLALGALAALILMLLVVAIVDWLNLAVARVALLIFILAWVGQFIGHVIEGRRPSFFKDLQFLLIGPLWLLSFVYRKLQIPY